MSDSTFPSHTPRVSVVIATLGGYSLTSTITALNRGTLVPDEILVCIPEQESPRTAHLFFKNLKIITTACRGQVAQRAFGFRQVRNELVLQLDDDVSLRPNCLRSLVSCVETTQKISAGPKLYDIKTGLYSSFLIPDPQGSTLFQKLMFWVINGRRGYEPGRIGRAGIGMGIPDTMQGCVDVDWLPGGCVLHRRENLVLFDFYPLKGKAFAEDLFHSRLLKKEGVTLMRCNHAECDVDLSSGVQLNPFHFMKSYVAYAAALRQFCKDSGDSSFFLYLFLILNLVRLIARRSTPKILKHL